MIQASVIHSRILSRLDAEGSDRYTFNEDTKYAINSAIEILVTMLNQAFAENKLAPENLRELNKTKVWQTNSFSRIAFSEAEVGHPLWSIIAVYPKCKTNKSSAIPSITPGGNNSKFRPDVTLVSSGQSAKRLTQEQWNENENNAFMAGNNLLKGDFQEFAYLDFADYTSTTYPGGTDKVEITVRPDVPNQFVAIAYLKYPNQVSEPNDLIEFPKSLTELITDLALAKIAEKQGDQTNLYSTAYQNINLLVGLIK
jgi:hypothetical protein